MTKAEFLDKMRTALAGKVSSSLVEENLNYYNEYIDSQMRLGRSESTVMDMLGDPRLIARTIVQTNGTDIEYDAETDYSQEGSGRNNNGYENTNEVKVRTVPYWVWTVLVVLFVVLVLGIVIRVVSFLLPIVLPVFIVLFLVKLFRDWLN